MNLEDLFSDILYTDDNPAIVKTERVFKDGDKVKRVSDIKSYDLISDEIISELRKCDRIEIDFYQKGILKIIRRYKKSEIVDKLKDVSDCDYKFVAMNTKTRNKLFVTNLSFHNLHLCDDINDDEIIVGDKISNCIINKNTGEYYFDKSSVKILYLR